MIPGGELAGNALADIAKEFPKPSMDNVGKGFEVPNNEGFSNLEKQEAKGFDVPKETGEFTEKEKMQDEVKADYLKDLREKSPAPETLPEKLDRQDWEKVTPDECRGKREEFEKKKPDLINEWEEKNGMKWPKYEEDVQTDEGKIIRRAGDNYDAHHIRPLERGGENTAENLTPLHANDHYDHKGVHRPDGPYKNF